MSNKKFDKSYYEGGENSKSNYKDYEKKKKSQKWYFDLLNNLHFFHNPTPTKIIDIGCAYGYLINKCYQKFNTECIGVDVSSYAIKKCQIEYKKINFLCEDIEEGLSIQDNYLSHVTMLDVIEHLHSPYLALLNINKKMQIGGKIALRTPNIASMESKVLGNKYHGYKDDTHLYLFCFETLSRLILKAGFEIINKGSDQYPLPFLPNLMLGGSIWIIARKINSIDK